jgi:hypothetical protein
MPESLLGSDGKGISSYALSVSLALALQELKHQSDHEIATLHEEVDELRDRIALLESVIFGAKGGDR